MEEKGRLLEKGVMRRKGDFWKRVAFGSSRKGKKKKKKRAFPHVDCTRLLLTFTHTALT